MRIAITANGSTLNADVDPRFGRCAWFLIVDPDTLEFEAIENSNATLGQGAGIQSAQTLAGRNVDAVLTGNCGPNAHEALTAAGIEVILERSGTVMHVIGEYKAGHLATADKPNVLGHSGAGEEPPATAAPAAPASPAEAGRPLTRQGMRQGMGRGGGLGRRGRGGGAGRGRGSRVA